MSRTPENIKADLDHIRWQIQTNRKEPTTKANLNRLLKEAETRFSGSDDLVDESNVIYAQRLAEELL